MFSALFFDNSGPLGISKELWWTLITTGLIGGLLPFTWSFLLARKAEPILQHLGVMLSWNHEQLGKEIEEMPNKYGLYCEKIQHEIGLMGPFVVSRRDLVTALGNYLGAINELWWWLDLQTDPKLKVPSHLMRPEVTKDDLASAANQAYRKLIEKLKTNAGYHRPWSWTTR